MKGASDAAVKDLSDRYLGDQSPSPVVPTASSQQAKSKPASTNKLQVSGSKPPSAAVSSTQYRHHDVDDDELEFEKYKLMKMKTPAPQKPSVFNRFKPNINLSAGKPKTQPEVRRPTSQKDRIYKYALAKKADWESLPRAVALYNYRAEMICDLEFRKGQIIEVMTRTGSQFDWWEGRVNDKVGIFPANYVKLI